MMLAHETTRAKLGGFSSSRLSWAGPCPEPDPEPEPELVCITSSNLAGVTSTIVFVVGWAVFNRKARDVVEEL